MANRPTSLPHRHRPVASESIARPVDCSSPNARPGVTIFGGIAWRRIAAAAMRAGVGAAMIPEPPWPTIVSAPVTGPSSAMNARTLTQPWGMRRTSIVVSHPIRSARIATSISLRRASLATSGVASPGEAMNVPASGLIWASVAAKSMQGKGHRSSPGGPSIAMAVRRFATGPMGAAPAIDPMATVPPRARMPRRWPPAEQPRRYRSRPARKRRARYVPRAGKGPSRARRRRRAR